MKSLAEYLADPERRQREAARVADDVDRRATQAWSQAVNCEQGRCIYANPPSELPAACQGYLGVKHIEHGIPLMRYRRCDRYFAWHRAKVERERAQTKGKAPR